jgi:hypothetical protein
VRFKLYVNRIQLVQPPTVAGEMLAIITVRELPMKESRKTSVSFEPRCSAAGCVRKANFETGFFHLIGYRLWF